jgi:type I restriction enzyme M protein
MGYEVPPKSNANYGWILNMVSKLSENGVAGFIISFHIHSPNALNP